MRYEIRSFWLKFNNISCKAVSSALLFTLHWEGELKGILLSILHCVLHVQILSRNELLNFNSNHNVIVYFTINPVIFAMHNTL